MQVVLLRRVAAALAAVLASVPFAAGARAVSQAFVALDYRASPEANGCPDAAEVRASVERQLGYDPFRPGADRRVVVQITRKEAGFEGRIQWSDAAGHWAGERKLSSRRPECAEIAASVAFSVAVQVQLLATLAPALAPAPATSAPDSNPPASAAAAPTRARAPDAAAATAVRPREPSVTVTPPEPPEPPAPARARRLALFVGIGPSLALGVAPKATGLGRLFVSGRSSWFSLELAADAALPTTQHDSGASGFALDRFAAEVAACGHARAFAACLTTTVGLLRARGFGVDDSLGPSGVFSQVGARIVAAHDFGGPYFAAARVDGVVMTSPWIVTLNEVPVWTTPRVGVVLGLDLGARFF